jgi:hypothetical protein
VLFPTQLFLFLTLASGPEAAQADAPIREDDGPEQFDLALFRTTGLVDADFRDELQLRMPDTELRPHAEAGDLSEREATYLYLETRAKTPTLYQIAVIVSDGRAYFGEVAVDKGLRPERVVASTLANLIFSIQQGTAVPDQENASIPPVEAGAPAPAPAPAPTDEPGSTAAAEPATTAPSPALEVAVTPGLGYALALGPPRHGDVYLGAGGGAGVELRTRRGVHAFVDFRALGRTVGAFRVTRLRAAIGAGFAWRHDRLELVTDLAVAVEPWVVSSTDGIQPVTHDGVSGRPPLLSAFLRLSPGYRISLDAGAIKGLRVGPRVDVAAGFVPTPAPRLAGLEDEGGRELVRIGGAELTTAIELAVWLGR